MILTGGLPLFYTMALCLIIDTTDDKTRGMRFVNKIPFFYLTSGNFFLRCRMSFYEAACLAGQVVGSFSSSYIYNATNYVIVFVLSSLILLISLLHVVFFIEESVIKNNDEVSSNRKLFAKRKKELKNFFLGSFQIKRHLRRV